jgi:hypothetical protein
VGGVRGGVVTELGLTGREAQLFTVGFTRAAYELYQNFGDIPASDYPAASEVVPALANAVRDAIA